ncbi:hypothetical protein POTOM_057697 [Populus tomentosa]|uniref:BHLH domain-containing protein n=1 Tax=Populus tomentosa TaxID=118781 RepID=A0A8X7XT41_POPTO|nr:hypothetical protein POTOM_057697 [Populus tomentosa]
MESFEDISEYQNYWEMTSMFLNDELKSWAMDQASSQYYDSSSPDEAASAVASKNTVSERNRRKKLNDKLLELRQAVPKISKLDKASIIKDAIDYIQDLQEQETRLQAEIMELESERSEKDKGFEFERELPVLLTSKKTRYDNTSDHRVLRSDPIEVHQLRVSSMGEKTLFVSLTCSQAREAMVKICEVFESLKLKIITASVTTVSGMVKKTLLIEPHSQSMESFENISEYQNYWEMTSMFWNDELTSWEMDQASSQIYDSSSPDGAASASASRNTVSERNRRKKLNDKLYALREAVPRISKLDKASIIKDAIDYIQDLQEQETRLQAEIMELESERSEKDKGFEFERELPVLLTSKKTRYDHISDHRVPRSDPIEVHQLTVSSMGEKTLFVSLTCSQAREAMVKICEVFESLKLKIITASVTTVSGMVKKTLLIEADVEEIDHLKSRIERAIKALSGPYNPQSM